MPAPAPVMPRQMLPPPTTTATSTSRLRRGSTISPASWFTTSPSMEYPLGSAKAWPESFRTTRRQRGLISSATGRSGADLDLGEAHDLGAAQVGGDGLLLVAGVGLLEQHAAGGSLEPPAELALDDLRQGLLG